MMRHSILLLTLLTPTVLVAQGVADGGARPISLDEAVRLAQRNSPQTVQARGAISTGEATVRSAWGAYIPTINLNTGASRQGGETFFQGQLVPYRGDPWSFSRGLSTSLELFDGMRRVNTLRSARASVDAAESNERLQRFAVALSVKQQYYNVLAARESRTAALAQLAQAEEQLKASSARVAAGAATKSDSLRSVIQVGNGRLALLTAENSLRVANASLTRLVGTPFTITAEAEEGAEIPPVRLDSAALESWIGESPSVVQAQSNVEAARASYRASRSPYLPTLSLSYNVNGSNTASSFDWGSGTYAFQKTTRFTLSYPLFNGFQREENVNRASVSETNAQASLRDARLLAQQQLTANVGNLELAQERVAIQLSSVAAADEDLRVQNQRYALGSSTLLDVLTSQLTLNQARQALIQARYDARVAKAQIEALIGRDIP
jgi:outer membrane protein